VDLALANSVFDLARRRGQSLREPEIYYRRIMDAISPGGIGGGNFPEWVTSRAIAPGVRARLKRGNARARARAGKGKPREMEPARNRRRDVVKITRVSIHERYHQSTSPSKERMPRNECR